MSEDDEKSNEFNQEKLQSNQKEKKTIELFIHLTIITELTKKENGETKCICHNLITPQIDIEEEIKANSKILIKDDFIIENSNNLKSKTNNNKTNNENNDEYNNNENENNIKENNENNKNIFIETEIIPIMTIPILSDGRILFNDIISQLKYLGYPIIGALFSVYILQAEDYVFIGAEPLDQNFYLSSNDVDLNCLKIKMVCYIEDKLVKKTEKQLFERKHNFTKKTKDKRTKERRIGFIVEKVNAWRRLYNGFYNENGEHTRYSLDQAAKMIDISKKSLDDYLLQLRLGRKYGFDFNSNKNNKVGVLRSFVKMHRAMKSSNNTLKDNSDDNNEDEEK